MSNNNTQFCFEVQLNSPEEAEWIETKLALTDKWGTPPAANETGDLLEQLEDMFPEWAEFECLGFEWMIGAETPTLCIQDSGGEGNLGFVTDFLQAYLLKFKIKGGIGFDWAETCSRHLPGQFGGGAVVVTAFSAEWTNTGNWLKRKLDELK